MDVIDIGVNNQGWFYLILQKSRISDSISDTYKIKKIKAYYNFLK